MYTIPLSNGYKVQTFKTFGCHEYIPYILVPNIYQHKFLRTYRGSRHNICVLGWVGVSNVTDIVYCAESVGRGGEREPENWSMGQTIY